MTTRQLGTVLCVVVLIWMIAGLTALPASAQEATRAVTVELTVAGQIQLNDPWTSGGMRTNQWAKPMYRIWFDTNGNPKDGGYGNGQGSYQGHLWLDTARVGFRWHGPDGQAGNADDVQTAILSDRSRHPFPKT